MSKIATATTLPFRNKLLTCLLLVAATQARPAIAQMPAPNKQIFVGLSYIRTDDTPNVNAYGWAASYSEHPYPSLPWLGGSIEANAGYASPGVAAGNRTVNGLLRDTIYTFTGGPEINLPRYRSFRPFGHFLLGATLAWTDTTAQGERTLGSSYSSSKTSFGYLLGGGADRRIYGNLFARGQADWLRSSFADQNTARQNNLQVSVGVSVKF